MCAGRAELRVSGGRRRLDRLGRRRGEQVRVLLTGGLAQGPRGGHEIDVAGADEIRISSRRVRIGGGRSGDRRRRPPRGIQRHPHDVPVAPAARHERSAVGRDGDMTRRLTGADGGADRDERLLARAPERLHFAALLECRIHDIERRVRVIHDGESAAATSPVKESGPPRGGRRAPRRAASRSLMHGRPCRRSSRRGRTSRVDEVVPDDDGIAGGAHADHGDAACRSSSRARARSPAPRGVGLRTSGPRRCRPSSPGKYSRIGVAWWKSDWLTGTSSNR